MEGAIYAYHAPRSTEQRIYVEQRVAQLAEERHKKNNNHNHNQNSNSDKQQQQHHNGSTSVDRYQSVVIERRQRQQQQHSRSTSSAATTIHAPERHAHKNSLRKNSDNNVAMESFLAPTATRGMMGNNRSTVSLGSGYSQQSSSTSASASSSSSSWHPRVASDRQQQQQQSQQPQQSQQQQDAEWQHRNPFELRHGRRYLRGVPYPLPCDLAELQRQNLRTLLCMSVLGKPVCASQWAGDDAAATAPRRVLEIGCGSGYWSAMAHEYFRQRGAPDVEFVGLDIAPMASDWRKQGVNWEFIQYDIRRVPLPFDDGTFDMVMIKDMSLAISIGARSEKVISDCLRLLRPGGTIEFWDSDYVVRSLLPDTPPPFSKRQQDQDIADETATFAVATGHPFMSAHNKYLVKANKWIADALGRRKLCPTPCARIGELLLQETTVTAIDQRRVAIPFRELRWEKQTPARRGRRVSNGHDSPLSVGSWEKQSWAGKGLTPDQAALRETALMTVLQQIESMEPMLREVSGKNGEEWSQWWTSMMSDLLDPSNGSLTGECLEIGAWWATKKPEDGWAGGL